MMIRVPSKHQSRGNGGGRILHRSPDASDSGLSLLELIINMMLTGLVVASVTGLIAMSLRMFGVRKNISSRPQRIVQQELARTAERMLIKEECENPALPTVTSHIECLEGKEISFPQPMPKPAGLPSHIDPDYALCWMVESQGTEGATKRPTSYTNKDSRDLECWYHDPNDESIRAAIYHSSTITGDTSLLYSPTWASAPYTSPQIVSGIERLGYCTKTDGSMSGMNKSACPVANWHRAWECIGGIDTNPNSPINSAVAPSALTVQDCVTNTGNFSNGVAVLTLRVCVSMSHAELRQRSDEDNDLSSHPLTCNGKDVTVTPGHK